MQKQINIPNKHVSFLFIQPQSNILHLFASISRLASSHSQITPMFSYICYLCLPFCLLLKSSVETFNETMCLFLSMGPKVIFSVYLLLSWLDCIIPNFITCSHVDKERLQSTRNQVNWFHFQYLAIFTSKQKNKNK